MSDHLPPPLRPPRPIVLRTAPEILKQTTTTIFSSGQNLLIFLLLSLFLLSLRGSVEMATHILTSFIDTDPSIKSFVDRVDGPPKPTTPAATITTRRRPFPQLTRVGTLDDDFFSGDDEFNHQLNATSVPKKNKLNATSFILDSFDPQLGFSNFVSDNGIRASEIVRSTAKMTFRSIEVIQKEKNVSIDEFKDSAPFNKTAESQTYFRSFLKRLDLEHHEFNALMIFSVAFTASYWFIIQGFLHTYTKVHGIIFVLVLNDLCKRRNSFHATLCNGSFLGLKRSIRFIAIRFIVRVIFVHLLIVWFFRGINDPYSQVKIFIWSKFMPISIMFPWDWDKGFEKEINSFIVTCFLLDMLMSFVYSVVVWILMADSRKNVQDVVKEACHLVSLMIESAIELKCYENIVYGPFARWVLTRFFGVLFAIAFQSFMEVYFMVAWMMYYLSVKSIDADSRGQPFGQRELKAMLGDVR